MKKINFITIILLLFFVLSCSAKKFATTDITITREDGTSVTLNAEIARTDEERQHGFMERKTIPDGTGMIFIFEKDQILNFWMKNTPTALSIAYIDRNGVIRDVFDMKPFSTATVSSTTSVRYALEVPKGWFERVNVKPGDKVLLDSLNF
ncbi:MAG: DUF192 domain-containing protein [Treponema sp.]|nr:DUF192 domain-containing protein [Treponema sp.]